MVGKHVTARYLLANPKTRGMYVGPTNHPERRVHEPKHQLTKRFSQRHNVNNLVDGMSLE